MIARVGIDSHIGHACNGTNRGHPKPFHKTPYVVAGQTQVTVNGSFAVLGAGNGSTACGDNAIGGSTMVTITGRPVHRTGDATSGHLCHFVPSVCGPASPTVFAWA